MLSGSSPSMRSPGSSGNALNSSANPTTNQQLAFSSSYPNPPMQYINLFSDENILKGKCPEPPKPIVDGTYSMFGVSMTNDEAIIRPLESQGIKRLYPRDYDHKRELKKMNASILVNFLDLLDVLVKCPDTSKREEKCSDIAMLFVQMHHLINELRPHQGRETIRVTLQCQKRQRLDIIQRLNNQIERVHELITNTINSIEESNESNDNSDQMLVSKVKTELIEDELNTKHSKLTTSKSMFVDQLDQLMCSIIDEI